MIKSRREKLKINRERNSILRRISRNRNTFQDAISIEKNRQNDESDWLK